MDFAFAVCGKVPSQVCAQGAGHRRVYCAWIDPLEGRYLSTLDSLVILLLPSPAPLRPLHAAPEFLDPLHRGHPHLGTEPPDLPDLWHTQARRALSIGPREAALPSPNHCLHDGVQTPAISRLECSASSVRTLLGYQPSQDDGSGEAAPARRKSAGILGRESPFLRSESHSPFIETTTA